MVDFHDAFAEHYHLIYAQWDYAIDRQSNILNALIVLHSDHVGGDPLSLLDCSCGIGTQAIGLAKRGYIVTATDLSVSSIQRAKWEAECRGVKITFGVADLRSLKSDVVGDFDVVLTADNAIPHLQSDDDLYRPV